MTRNNVRESLEGPVAILGEQSSAEQHVLIRERQQGSTELIGKERLEGLLRLRVAVNEAETNQQARCAADSLQCGK